MKNLRLNILLMGSFIVGSMLILSPPAVNANHLFKDSTDSSENITEKLNKRAEVIRSRHVKIDLNVLEESDSEVSRSRGMAPSKPKIRLNLFSDTTLDAVSDKVRKHSRGLDWVGHVEGDAESSVIMVERDGVVAGTIKYNGKLFKIYSRSDDIHVIEEIDISALPTIPNDAVTVLELSDDSDGDSVPQNQDNCTEVANTHQIDTDSDGYGNACDADYNNDGIVNGSDFWILRKAFGTKVGDPNYNPDVDNTGDNIIGMPDFQVFRSQLRSSPGPSGLDCAGSTSCTADFDQDPIQQVSSSQGASAPADDGTIIDVLVVYTPAARSAMGGAAGINALIDLAVLEANTAYANSNITPRLNLVHKAEVAYTELDYSSDLSRLRGTTDGFMDEVHTLRDAFNADIVALIESTSGVCGVGYLMGPGSVNTAFASNAFSLTQYSCATGNFTFAHELGHNMGSHHNIENAGSTPAFPYSYGYQAPDNAFRTVMAYNCTGGCPRIPQFSNPDIMSGGQSTGIVDAADNARSIDDTSFVVSNFRISEIDTIPPALVADFILDSTSLSSVTLSWTSTGDDGTTGQAAAYDLRYSLSPIFDDAAFAAATQVTGMPFPQLPGNAEVYTVTGLQSETTYFLRLKVLDNVGNESLMSDSVVATTTSGVVLFSEDFESGLNGWTSDGLWHLTNQLRSNSPTFSFAYNDGNTAGPQYETGAANSGRLVSPPIDLTFSNAAILSFAHWYQTESSDSTWDLKFIDVSTDSGVTWQTEHLVLTGINAVMSTWQTSTVDLSSYVGGSIQLRFHFNTVDAVANTFEGWYIDDVAILTDPLPNNPPTANNQSVNVFQDTAQAILLTASDLEGSPLTYSVVTPPTNGSLSGTAPNVIYTPNTGYLGSDSFTFIANDGDDDSNVATVTINVSEAPIPVIWTDLVGVTASGNTITKTASTTWGNAGAASLQTIPTDGSVDFLADESSTYRMAGLSSSNADANYTTIHYALHLRPGGAIYIYESGVLRGNLGTYVVGDRVSVERVGSTIDYKKNGISFYTSTVPSSGPLVVDAAIYNTGSKINDANIVGGQLPPNNPPVAQDQNVSVDENTAKAITLTATDQEGSPLTYSVIAPPLNGSLSGTAPNLTYTPNTGYLGSDTIEFIANDGDDDSNLAFVNITVSAVIPSTGVIWTDLVGVTASGNTITKTAGNGWGNAGAASMQTILGDGYVNFHADETSTYRMAGLSSTNANANYTTIDYALHLRPGGQILIYESGVSKGSVGSYVVGDRVSVERTGTTIEYKKNGNVLYTSLVLSSGSLVVDAAIYSTGAKIDDANIGGGQLPPNNPPVAYPQSLTTFVDVNLPITLTATDPDGPPPLMYGLVVASMPTNGVLQLSPSLPNVTYIPNAGYVGPDSFQFFALDGLNSPSANETITINVITAPIITPVIWTDLVGVGTSGNTITKTAGNGWGNGGAASMQTILGDGFVDFLADGNSTYRMAGLSSSNIDASYTTIDYALHLRPGGAIYIYESGVSKGSVGSYVVGDRVSVERTGTTIEYKKNGNVLYTSLVLSSGSLVVDAAIYNSGATIADANIGGGQLPPNNPPVAQNQNVFVDENTAEAITLTATDQEGSPLTYSVVTPPVNGSLSGTAPNLTYTPNTGYIGSDSFTFIANDGDDDSNLAIVNITVAAVIPSTGVIWTDLVGVTASGNTITKTASTSWSNGGAASLQLITGDGGVDFLADDTTTYRMAGLSSSNANANYNTIDYALHLRSGGAIYIYESGSYKGNPSSYNVGDRVSVERTGTTIEYKKNGSVIYTSTLSSSGSLIVDASIYTTGGTIADANIVGGSMPPNNAPVAYDQNTSVVINTSKAITLTATDQEGSPLTYAVVTPPVNGGLSGTAPNLTYTPNTDYLGGDTFTFLASDGTDNSNIATVNITVTLQPTPVIWTDLVGVSVNGNTITKTASTTWGNGGAASSQIVSGDGGVDFRIDQSGTYLLCGLSATNVNANYNTIDYGIHLRANGTIYIYEKGIFRGNVGTYNVGDRFSVKRVGSTVSYYQNDSLLFTSAALSSGGLVVDAAIYNTGAMISDANIIITLPSF